MIGCAYESLRCLDLEIGDFCTNDDDNNDDTTDDYFTPCCACVHGVITYTNSTVLVDPAPKRGGKGLGTGECFLGCATSAVLFSGKHIRSQL